uniref:NADH:ubiquinone oxidoreductase 30kDa subunit domain-containing protein n=1 Tax=Aegilops tauschii subsp. strangulata TaxID=200361 RepID=A0A453NNV1_AEGTS
VFWIWRSADFQERESYDMVGISRGIETLQIKAGDWDSIAVILFLLFLSKNRYWLRDNQIDFHRVNP